MLLWRTCSPCVGLPSPTAFILAGEDACDGWEGASNTFLGQIIPTRLKGGCVCFLSPPQSGDLGTPPGSGRLSGTLAASAPWLLPRCLISSSISPLQEEEAALLGRPQQHRHLAFMCNFDLKRSEEPSSVRGSQVLSPPSGHPPARGVIRASREQLSTGARSRCRPPARSLKALLRGSTSSGITSRFLLRASCLWHGGGPHCPPCPTVLPAPAHPGCPRGLTVQDGCIQGSPSTCMGSSLDVLQGTKRGNAG